MNYSILLYVLEVFGFSLIALLAVSRKKTKLETLFSIFAFSVMLWQLMFLLSVVASDYGFIAQTLFITGVAISPIMSLSLFLFAQAYARKAITGSLIPLGVLVGLLAYWSESLRRVRITSEGIGIPELDMQYLTIVIFHIVMLMLTVALFIFNYRNTQSRIVKEQSKIILIGVVGAGIIGVLGSFSSSSFSSTIVAQNILPAASLIALGSLFYAVTYKGLIDIRLAVVRSAGYVLSIVALALIYFAVVYFGSALVFNERSVHGFNSGMLNVILTLVLAVLFQPLKKFFDKGTDRFFYRDKYDTSEFFTRLSSTLTESSNLRILLTRAAREIGNTLKSEQAFFFVRYKSSRYLSAGTTQHKTMPVSDIESLDRYVAKNGEKIIIVDRLDGEGQEYRILRSHGISVLMPLIMDKITIGYLALGEQQGSGYAARDIKVLQATSHELVIAIQNSLSIQEVRDINANLEQRIEAATAELRTSNARLKRLDATKDEFISMASHQLRTPLTSIKGYLSMVLEGNAGKITKDQRHLLQEAFVSSERMVHLIHDFLNVSRLQNGKFTLERRDYDIVTLVQGEINGLQRVAETRDLKVIYKSSVKSQLLSLDETKIRQVVMNFIDNAIFYSNPKSAINVTLEKVGDAIELRVTDTGIGVPKAEQEHLFTKFFRAANARKQRPDGTGVGIFLAKKVINAHGGEIIFESTEGKGSTFGFTLPLK